MILIWFQITFGGIDFDLISNHILGDFRWFWFLKIQNQFMLRGLEIFKNKFLISWCFATTVTCFGFFLTFCNNNKWDSRVVDHGRRQQSVLRNNIPNPAMATTLLTRWSNLTEVLWKCLEIIVISWIRIGKLAASTT